MRRETIDKLCCPFDKQDLELTEVTHTPEGEVLEGFLVCSQGCQRLYPIIKGIPIMNPDEYREFTLEKPVLDRWEKHMKGKTIENFRLHDAPALNAGE